MVRNNAKKKDLEKTGVAVHGLSRIVGGPVRDLDQLLDELLRLGCEVFELDVGAVSKIEGDRYEVVATMAPSTAGLKRGTILDLAETFCARTLEHDGPTTIAASAAELASPKSAT